MFVGGILVTAACATASGSSSGPTPSRVTLALTPNSVSSAPSAPTSASTVRPTTVKTVSTVPVTPATAAPATTARPVTAPTAPTTSVAYVPSGLAAVIDITDITADPLIAVGKANGTATKRVQARLIELGFWLSAVDGKYGLATIQAVMAFQKYAGLKASGLTDNATASALTRSEFRASASATDNTLVEIDKRKQLLFLVDDGRTTWVFNTSTGTGEKYEAVNQNTGRIEKGVSITPDGLWAVNRQHEDGWWDGDLGKIYRPKYFKGGIAIHGMNNVPNYPASHGCVRLSLPAMDYIWASGLIPKGTTVWVHGGD